MAHSITTLGLADYVGGSPRVEERDAFGFAREMDWALAMARLIPLSRYFQRWGSRRV